MTRINAGIPPAELSGKHLIAEHREIKRIPNMVRKGVNMSGIPNNFVLGTGHVKFFYNKLGYLLKRYESIHIECIERGYNVQDYCDAWSGLPPELMNDWNPTADSIALIRQRIAERTKETKLK